MCLPNLPEARDVTIIINTIELRFWLFYEDSEDLDKLLSFCQQSMQIVDQGSTFSC
jgi:hypothetical protein